jgi:Ala-tRNA(Pro) deacylase
LTGFFIFAKIFYMPIPKKVINFLGKTKVKYEPIKHRIVYTAFDKAATLKVKPKIVGKTLVVKLDRNPALVLIPANKNLDKEKLRKIAKAKTIDFIKEVWMKKNIKGIKVGAIPPFGNFFKLKTFIDNSLLKEPKIIINGGDYNWSIKISPSNFKKLIPDLVIGNFSKARKPR